MRKPVEPIFTAHLFSELDAELIRYLKSLKPEDFFKPTRAGSWKVKDIAAHLLDGSLRQLSLLRDHSRIVPSKPITSYGNLVAYLNDLNAVWTKAFERVSPEILISLLELTGPPFNQVIAALDPFAKAVFPVAWAGETESPNWFHVAREYTEKWHHQQQIREATGDDQTLLAAKWYLPYLETSIRALPHHYRNVTSEKGTVIRFTIPQIPNATWFMEYDGTRWRLFSEHDTPPVTTVILPSAMAWRLFTKGISTAEAKEIVDIQGRYELGEKIFGVLAVMA